MKRAPAAFQIVFGGQRRKSMDKILCQNECQQTVSKYLKRWPKYMPDISKADIGKKHWRKAVTLCNKLKKKKK